MIVIDDILVTAAAAVMRTDGVYGGCSDGSGDNEGNDDGDDNDDDDDGDGNQTSALLEVTLGDRLCITTR